MASYSSSVGGSDEDQKTTTRIVKGFENGYIGSKTTNQNKKFLEVTEGSISTSEAKVVQYGAKMNPNVKPVFTDDFAEEIRKLHAYTIVVSLRTRIIGLS